MFDNNQFFNLSTGKSAIEATKNTLLNIHINGNILIVLFPNANTMVLNLNNHTT